MHETCFEDYDLANGWAIARHWFDGTGLSDESNNSTVSLPSSELIQPKLAPNDEPKASSSSSSPKKRSKATPSPSNLAQNSDFDNEEYFPSRKPKRHSLSPLSESVSRQATAHRVNQVLSTVGNYCSTPVEQMDLLRQCLGHLDSTSAKMDRIEFSLRSVSDVLMKMSVEAPIRSRIMHSLAQLSSYHPTQAELADALNISCRAYQRHQKTSTHSNVAELSHEGHRGRPTLPDFDFITTSTLSQAQLLDWLRNNTNVKSGTRNYRKLRSTTFHSAYETYSAQIGDGALSYKHFVKTLHRWGIHTEKYDKYACPTCLLPHVQPKYDEHKQSIAKQFEAFQQHKADVLAGRAALLVTDYCRVHELGCINMNIRGCTIGTSMKLSCLSFSFVCRDVRPLFE